MTRQLTEAEAKAREERWKGRGFKVTTDAPSTVTLLRRTTEEMLAEAMAAGVEVTVTQPPKGTGEIVPLPGVS